MNSETVDALLRTVAALLQYTWFRNNETEPWICNCCNAMVQPFIYIKGPPNVLKYHKESCEVRQAVEEDMGVLARVRASLESEPKDEQPVIEKRTAPDSRIFRLMARHAQSQANKAADFLTQHRGAELALSYSVPIFGYTDSVLTLVAFGEHADTLHEAVRAAIELEESVLPHNQNAYMIEYDAEQNHRFIQTGNHRITCNNLSVEGCACFRCTSPFFSESVLTNSTVNYEE